MLCKPGIKPHTHFTAEVYVLSKEEGGRHTPFFNNYRPQFYFRTTDVTGAVELPKDKEMVMPGDNVSITVKLIAPIAMEEGLRFAIREGGRTVGAGVVPRSSVRSKARQGIAQLAERRSPKPEVGVRDPLPLPDRGLRPHWQNCPAREEDRVRPCGLCC